MLRSIKKFGGKRSLLQALNIVILSHIDFYKAVAKILMNHNLFFWQYPELEQSLDAILKREKYLYVVRVIIILCIDFTGMHQKFDAVCLMLPKFNMHFFLLKQCIKFF